MQSNRGKDTRPELEVRRLLYARGYRYRVNFAPLPGFRRRADIVFTRVKLAVFIDGCFWHGCPEHATLPKSNAEFWLPKLEQNKSRDRETEERLAAAGWHVLRLWEHTSAEESARSIADALRADS